MSTYTGWLLRKRRDVFPTGSSVVTRDTTHRRVLVSLYKMRNEDAYRNYEHLTNCSSNEYECEYHKRTICGERERK